MHQDSDTPSVKGKNYADFSREELIAEINKLKKTKKYGLVWEHKTEEVIENFKKGAQPYLKEIDDKRLELAPDEPTNLIIEGDNFDALSILNYTHAGKIDVIYIDPPYNTGNKDFIYNDDYVDSEDAFRHSKWLSFMEPRLIICKRLLSEDGAIFISVDDNEQSQLKIMCDSIFGSKNFVACIPRMTSAQRPAQEAYVSTQHDYLLIYTKCNAGSFNKIIEREGLEKAKKDHIGTFIPGDTSPILASATQGYSSGGDYDFTYKGITYSPIASNGSRRRWLWTKDRMEKAAELGIIIPTNSGGIRVQNYIDMEFEVGTNEMKPKESNLILASYDFMKAKYANKLGAQALTGIGVDFSFPKPAALIKDIIKLSTNNNAIVLDFFAGSGTTGQAVLELNKEDGGHRQFILCTNNGDKGPDSTKIAEDITYPRIKTVITGERQDGSRYSDGIPANLRYHKIDHRQKKDSVDATRQDIVNYLEDIIKIKENTFGAVEANEDFSLYQNPEQYLGMVFDPFSLEEVIEKLTVANADKRPVKLYVFSYSRDAFEEDFGTDFEIEFVAMPEGLLKTYVNIIEDLKKEDA